MKGQKKSIRDWALAAMVASMLVSTSALAQSSSGSNNTTACGAVMCLISSAAGNTPSECEQYLKAYFAIVEFKHGDFSPSKTLSARANFLNQCKSSDPNSRNSVNNQYGSQQFGF